MFLGANIDAVNEAGNLGVDGSRAVQFHNDTEGVALNYKLVSEAICELRASGSVSSKWENSIEEDYIKRR
jgi:hypothetical protein